MNCLELVTRRIQDSPTKMAIWDRHYGAVTYAEFGGLIKFYQKLLLSERVTQGARVVVVAEPDQRMYASLAALLSLGAEADRRPV